MKRVLVLLSLLIGLAGCANPYVNKYTEADNWVGLAYYDVESGHKARSATDLDKLGAKSMQAQAQYLEAYKSHVSTYCNPENAYRAGILDKPRNAVCIDGTPTGWEYEQNWKTGLEAGSL